MSYYTTEVRFICENYAGLDESKGQTNVNDILSKSWNKVFDFNFPIFDENYRSVLCQKILKHYYTREIAFETVGLWKLKLDTMMNEIMPYYNKLYESELLEFDPFKDADYTKEHEGEDGGSGKDTGTTTQNDTGTHTGTIGDVGQRDARITDNGTHAETIGDVGNVKLQETSWDVYSDTPQGALTNVDNNTYLTNARKVTHNAETDTTNDRDINGTDSNTKVIDEDTTNTRTFNEGTSNTGRGTSELNRTYSNTDEYIDHVYGKFPGKSYMSMLKEFRETFLNIDMEVIDRLSELFFKLW